MLLVIQIGLQKVVIVLQIRVPMLNFVTIPYVMKALKVKINLQKTIVLYLFRKLMHFHLFFCGNFFCCLGCVVSNTNRTEESCDCSGNMCTDAQFCYNNVCNAHAKSNYKFYKTIIFFLPLFRNFVHFRFFSFFLGCVVSKTNRTAENCDCSGNVCTDAGILLQ